MSNRRPRKGNRPASPGLRIVDPVNTSDETTGESADTDRTTRSATRSRVTAAESRRLRDSEAARLRATGLSYEDIAAQVGYLDKSSAHKAVQRALSTSARLPTDEARMLALDRLDSVRKRLTTIMDTPGVSASIVVNAVRAFLDIERREAVLIGLDSPTKSERTTYVVRPETKVTASDLDAEIERLLGELADLDQHHPTDRQTDDGPSSAGGTR